MPIKGADDQQQGQKRYAAADPRPYGLLRLQLKNERDHHDVRGNAEVYGTIISMCDTTQWDSGYVTNIGATLDDGGSETTEPGDVGVINITPDEDKLLPSGIRTPIVIKCDGGSYVEL